MCAGRTALGCLDIRGFTGSSLGSLQFVSDKNGPDVHDQDCPATPMSLPLRLRRRGRVNHPRLSTDLTEELRREIVKDSTSEKGMHGFRPPRRSRAPLRRFQPTRNNPLSQTVRLFPQSGSTIQPSAQFKQETLPSSLCYSSRALKTVAERRDGGGLGGGEINAVKCGDRKMSF